MHFQTKKKKKKKKYFSIIDFGGAGMFPNVC